MAAEGTRVREEGERWRREREALERDREKLETFGRELQQRSLEIEDMCQVTVCGWIFINVGVDACGCGYMWDGVWVDVGGCGYGYVYIGGRGCVSGWQEGLKMNHMILSNNISSLCF